VADLPNWVYDLVTELLDQQETHPKLLFESGAFEGTQMYDWCPCTALLNVPADVINKAQAIAAYKRQTPTDTDGATA
jgi:hypothetical protein